MKIVALVQARMSSTRLPGKVLLDLAGKPMLARVVERARRASTLADVIVATTVDPSDDPIVRLCGECGWPVYRGDREDVLDRFYHAANVAEADVLVRITSDCPFIDPELIDFVVAVLLEGGNAVDYVSNFSRRTFPRGLDVEAVRFTALARAWREDQDPAWREHVTPYIYRHPELFVLRDVTHPVDCSAWRWTVDTPADYQLARTIYEHFGHDRFGWGDVAAAYAEHPDWWALNEHVEQKTLS